MSQSKIKSISRHKNNIATPAKREYNFFDVAKIIVPLDAIVHNKPHINDFLRQVDNAHGEPEIELRGK